jgi:hypothetical protein
MPPAGLSVRGLQRAATMSEKDFEFIDNDFEFIGNEYTLRCTLFQAVFLSPRVHSLLQQDKTLTSFFVEWKSQKIDENRVFEFLEDLMNGKPIDPLASEVESLWEAAISLGNTELIESFMHDEDPPDLSTVCVRLRLKSMVGLSTEKEIEFAASHFAEIEAEELKGIGVSLLELIVSSARLRLTSEDSLLRFILSLGSAGHLVLVRYLRSEYLSREGMRLLVERLGNSSCDRLLWDSLCHRLLVPRSKVEIPMDFPHSVHGIIWSLAEKPGGNIQEKGRVTITSKLITNSDLNAVTKIADVAAGSQSPSENEQGDWVCWDFREMRVRPTHYTIQSRSLQSWVLEGSLDGRRWTEIDRQTDRLNPRVQASNPTSIVYPTAGGWLVTLQPAYSDGQDLNALPTTASFAVSCSGDVRFIRLTQIGPSDQRATLYCVDFFGTLSG